MVCWLFVFTYLFFLRSRHNTRLSQLWRVRSHILFTLIAFCLFRSHKHKQSVKQDKVFQQLPILLWFNIIFYMRRFTATYWTHCFTSHVHYIGFKYTRSVFYAVLFPEVWLAAPCWALKVLHVDSGVLNLRNVYVCVYILCVLFNRNPTVKVSGGTGSSFSPWYSMKALHQFP